MSQSTPSPCLCFLDILKSNIDHLGAGCEHLLTNAPSTIIYERAWQAKCRCSTFSEDHCCSLGSMHDRLIMAGGCGEEEAAPAGVPAPEPGFDNLCSSHSGREHAALGSAAPQRCTHSCCHCRHHSRRAGVVLFPHIRARPEHRAHRRGASPLLTCTLHYSALSYVVLLFNWGCCPNDTMVVNKHVHAACRLLEQDGNSMLCGLNAARLWTSVQGYVLRE